MADSRQLANKARTTLAQALDALQSSPDVPEQLLEIAAPIAKSMGIMHRIEQSGVVDPAAAHEALSNVRGALDALQTVGNGSPAVETAMEAVAGSLSKLFALTRASGVEAARRAPAAAPALQAVAAQPQAAPAAQQAYAAPAAQQPAAQPAPAPQQWSATVPIDAPAAANAYASTAAAPVPDPFAQPAQPAAPPAPAAPQPAAAGGMVVSVELGAHSGSNFYKGLSGNDVIDYGGLFVATYKVPKIGSAVALRVLLPGDLEFTADGVVQWTRETRSGESEPGFGAKLTRIAPEGRQLVYRYVRNREPMFHDDM